MVQEVECGEENYRGNQKLDDFKAILDKYVLYRRAKMMKVTEGFHVDIRRWSQIFRKKVRWVLKFSYLFLDLLKYIYGNQRFQKPTNYQTGKYFCVFLKSTTWAVERIIVVIKLLFNA